MLRNCAPTWRLLCAREFKRGGPRGPVLLVARSRAVLGGLPSASYYFPVPATRCGGARRRVVVVGRFADLFPAAPVKA